jgi:hypothetical protein
MSEVNATTAEQRIEALETELKGLNAAFELRLRGIWKHDIDSAYRGQVNDIVSRSKEHTETDVQNHLRKADVNGRLNDQDRKVSERLNQHDARVTERISSAQRELEDRAANIVVRILAEYGVKGKDNQPIKFE